MCIARKMSCQLWYSEFCLNVENSSSAKCFFSNEKMGGNEVVHFRRVKNHSCGMHPPSKQIVVDRGNAKILKKSMVHFINLRSSKL